MDQSRHFGRRPALPVYSDQETFLVFVGMSQTCQKRPLNRI